MKAVMKGENGLCWTEVDDPQIREDEVLLEVYAAALNRADVMQSDGQYPPPEGWPEWLGLEAAGVIRDVGANVSREGLWRVGDRACALMGGGAQAEYAAVPSNMLMPIPGGLALTEAAALPEAFGAAYLFLFVEADMRRGETVLMQAGASGLASVVIPMARAFGARVITTVLTDDVAESIKHLGADRVVVTAREKLADVMRRELEAGRGVDIAIDCLGGEEAGECVKYMNRGGRWIMIATLAGDMTSVNLQALYARGAKLIGTTLRSRSPEAKAAILAQMVKTVWPKVETGEIRPTIYKTLPIQRAQEGHELMRAGRHVGKIVFTVKTDE